MANEGSTKPTYSNEELMANCQRERRLLVDECERLEAELLRVRGLLQRLMETAARYDAFGDNSFAFRATINEARQVLQAGTGAESADIGKLDSADKSGKVNRVDDWEAVIRAEDGNTTVLAVNILRLWPREQIERFAKHLLGDAAQAGSAETGGEKGKFHGEWFCPKCKQKTVNIYLPDSDEPSGDTHFRCENCDWYGSEPATFPRSSQNQTVSTGVEGAHEGTTADKKASKCKHGVSPNQTTACGNCDEEMREYSLSNLSDDSAPKHFEREFLESLLDTLRNSANRFQREGMSCEEVNHQMAELESRLADSREPEKLNNAQKCECGHGADEHDDGRLCCAHRQSASLMCLCDKFVALAESSLSSPPPKEKE